MSGKEISEEFIMPSQSCQPFRTQKRKRRSSDCPNNENVPINEDKKFKEEACIQLEDDASTNSPEHECERHPLSELPISEVTAGYDRNLSQHSAINDLISGQERLSISEPDSHCSSIQIDECLIDLEEGTCEDDDYERNSTSSKAIESSETDIDDRTAEVLGQLTPLNKTELIDLMPPLSRHNPLPALTWADVPDLWDLMCFKDEESVKYRDPDMFSSHPKLQPRMRTVLLDWIAEVCDVYNQHRETYYLTIDYLDRFLTAKKDIQKNQLQLIGISCLFIASKNEEIYPPKVADYAYVTDGACTENDILNMELAIIKTLSWKLTPITPNYWLKVYMQLCYQGKSCHELGFTYPQFSPTLFSRVSVLMDYASLDIQALNFSYSTIACCCIYLACCPELALHVSGLTENDIAPCLDWLTICWRGLKEVMPELRDDIKELPPGANARTAFDDAYNLQKHIITLEVFEKVQNYVEICEKENSRPYLITPPSSCKKSSQHETPRTEEDNTYEEDYIESTT